VTRSHSQTGEVSTPNGDAPGENLVEARTRVLHVQTKLHQWAKRDPTKRFDDLFNLVCDQATLVVAGDRVKSNRGARTAGVHGETKYYVEHRRGVPAFLASIRSALHERAFRPRPVRRRGIAKAGGKVRYLGIRDYPRPCRSDGPQAHPGTHL
jgi:RNA-directed DNA polymerase